MSGFSNPEQLLKNLSPELQEGEFVFCTFEDETYGAYEALRPVASFAEKEGLALILTKSSAEAASIPFKTTYRQITLQVYSSLEAVGLTAAVSSALARAGISANMMAAFHHDHIFVPSARAEEAVTVLQRLSQDDILS